MNRFPRAWRMMPFRKTLTTLAVLFLLALLACLVIFPGRQTSLALTYAFGWNLEHTQARIDRLEERAIQKQPFSDDDREFLYDLYATGVKGARITRVAPNASRLVGRYLDQSGEDLEIDAELAANSAPVQAEMKAMRRHIAWAVANQREVAERYESETFYMGDPAHLDAVASLYFGKLIVRPYVDDNGASRLAWRAEVPWVWPTYDKLFTQYGDPHAQNFALPNLRSIVFGPRYLLRVDDGLGGHLPELGLAKPFLAYAEWDEPWENE